MKLVSVVEIRNNRDTDEKEILFSDGSRLYSYHSTTCCENHYLCFDGISVEDFDGAVFDLSNDMFFSRIPAYGIQLNPLNGYSIRIPGYGSNNGYYSEHLSLILISPESEPKYYDITDCQVVSG